MQQPLAKMSRRLTDRASATKTRAVSPRTFSDVLPWHDFAPAALARLQELDDTKSCYMPQVIYVDVHAYDNNNSNNSNNNSNMLSHMSVQEYHTQAQVVMSSVTLAYRYMILLGWLRS